MKKTLLINVILFSLLNTSFTQVYEHPRGLIDKNDLALMRQRINEEPYTEFLNNIKMNKDLSLKRLYSKELEGNDVDNLAYLALAYAHIALLEDDRTMADSSFLHLVKIDSLDGFIDSLGAFGLTRATALMNLAMCYDFMYNYWTKEQRETVNKLLYKLMVSVNTSMGYEANYNIESNWMGVRYGSVVFSAIVWDDFDIFSNTSNKPRSKAMPILWDARHRLEEHMIANFSKNGWNIESLGYYGYDWFFSAPALIALQRYYKNTPDFELENFSPNAINATHAVATSSVSIKNKSGKGMKADLADDNAMIGFSQIVWGMKLMPAEQKPYLNWMFNYLSSPKTLETERGLYFYPIAFYDSKTESINPKENGWLNYSDEGQGVTVFRNDFKDENDIVATFTATAQRVDGHQGPDNLTFRILGLDSYWAIGAGRTGLIAGQTNLFTEDDLTGKRGNNSIGKLIDYKFYKNGSGYVIGSGSCMGVLNQKRFFAADYSVETGTKATFIVSDISDNGRYWRLNTPEFNTVKPTKDGFLIISPTGATMKATVLNQKKVTVSVEKLRYGGDTERNNPGICYKDSCYFYNKAIDIECDGDIIVVLTLEENNKEHPEIYFNKNAEYIRVGEMEIGIPAEFIK